MSLKIAVVIINYNSGDLLAKCIHHLLDQTRLPDNIIVVDNGSEDGSLARLPTSDMLQLIALKDNLGFAAANNLAFRHSPETDYFVTLNPDAFPRADFLQVLEKAAADHPGYASFASRMMLDDDIVDGAGDIYHISGLAWRNLHRQPYNAANHHQCDVFAPCAGAAMYRAADLTDVGGFDESFFCYMEDVDLGYRMQLRRKKCRYIPDAVALHMGSAISSKYPGFSAYHGHRNLVWVMIKNTPAPLLPAVMLAHSLMSIVLGVVYLFKGQPRVYLRAKIDAIKGSGRMWRKRKAIQQSRKISSREALRLYDYSFRR